MNPKAEERPLVSVEEQPTGVRAALYSVLGLLLQVCIEWLVRLTGKRIRKTESPWLDCVLGKPGVIGTGVYQRIAQEEKLEIGQPPDAGLIPSFESLRGPSFDPDRVDPRIRHFYEHTALYKLEVWSEVYFAGKFVLWLLVEFISRRMDQLNFPISSLEVAKGMTSEVVQLREPASGRLAYTGWLRRFRATGKVIYAGLYSVTQVPGEANPCVKVTFPCYGSSSVYLRPCVYADATFGLVSTGAAFGRSGFYRVVESGPDHWRVRNFTTLHEIFHVYADEDGILRTDHEITFIGLTILRLHYKMTLAKTAIAEDSASVRNSLQAV
ncbi:MAG TPA: hypothetical protein VFI45_05265 [Candidatus Acidoferrum sp.]|nr:hypothetical protein [Candidatus Acidoferrum sp.]